MHSVQKAKVTDRASQEARELLAKEPPAVATQYPQRKSTAWRGSKRMTLEELTLVRFNAINQ